MRRSSHTFIFADRFPAFTLVEVLLATTISALLVMTVVSTTRSLSTSRDKIESKSSRRLEARNGLEAMVAALRNVRRDGAGKNPVLIGYDGGEGQNDRINLMVIDDRRCREDGEESDQYEMTFYLWKPEGARFPSLMCRKDHALDDYPERGGLATVAAEGIVGLTFEYYDGETWREEWSDQETKPPKMVRVTLAAVETDRKETGWSMRPEPMVLSTAVAIESETKRETNESKDDKQNAGTQSDNKAESPAGEKR
jgi:type II secretory pathway pseudopilin PulG